MARQRPSFDPILFFATAGKGRMLVKYRKRQIVFAQGDSADHLFYVRKGKVKIVVTSEHGKEAVLAILGHGDFVGEACLSGIRLRHATACALTDCELTRIAKVAMISAIKGEPALSQLIMSYLLARTDRIQDDLIDQFFNSSELRLARVLLRLANYGKEEAPEPVLPHISQEMLAEMIGTTRARINFFMNKFRKLGLIKYNGHIEVHSSLLKFLLRDLRNKK